MSKYPIPIAHDIRPARRRSKLLWLVPVLFVSTVLTPLAVEGVELCYAQWCEVVGGSAEVRTPIINSVSEALQSARDVFGENIAPDLHRAVRDATIALPVCLVLIVLAMAMLRR